MFNKIDFRLLELDFFVEEMFLSMVINKNLGKILFSFYLATSLVFFSGCGKNKSPQFTDHGMPDFPIAEDGYPRSDVLMIDGNLYPLENIDLVSNTQQEVTNLSLKEKIASSSAVQDRLDALLQLQAKDLGVEDIFCKFFCKK